MRQTTGNEATNMADKMEVESAAEPNGLFLICKAEEDDAERFLHQLINQICQQRGPQFKDFSHVWNIKEWIEISDAWSEAIKAWVGGNVGKEEISETLSAKGLSDEWISRILISLTLRKNDIKQSLNSQSSCIAQSSLKNFDWNAKLVMSSDKLANIREPLSEIHFELKTEEGIKNVSLELDKEELKMLIDKMEAANKVAVQLHS